MATKQILVADPQVLVGEATKYLIEQEHDLQATCVMTGTSVLDALQKRSFDLVITELNLPEIGGLDLVRQIRRSHTNLPLLIYSGYELSHYFNDLVEAGACGFISKTDSKERVLRVIRNCIRGDATIPLELLKQLRRKNFLVTEREMELLQLLARQRSNQEIAETLHLSRRTIEYSLTGLFDKLKVTSRAEAVAKARKLNIIPDESFAL